MAKNVVICCDGTGNEIETQFTNVLRLFHILVHDTPEQQTFYLPGVGTMEAPGISTFIGRRGSIIVGQATGLGIYTNVERVLSFVMRNYNSLEGDRLFLFGFSRGAYTLQIVASLLHMWGLFRKGTEHVVPYAIKFSSQIGSKDDVQQRYKSCAEIFKQTFSRCVCPIHFMGMWDSVSSVGGPLSDPVGMPYIRYNPSIQNGRHAVAIDERRAFFRSELWQGPDASDQDIKQVWFPGVHADIGGGYPEAESGLSKITLQWMIKEAVAKELLVDSNRCETILGKQGGDYIPPNPDGEIHDSLKSFWKAAEFLPKRVWSADFGRMLRMNGGRWRTLPPGSMVHESVYQRGGGNYARRLEVARRLPMEVKMVA
jgi:uncharacterized protein (DUF2235 family)